MSATRRNLRSQDVLDLTGATYRQLDHWCTHHGVCGEDSVNPGQGTSRLFTITEARAVRAIYLAGTHGVSVGTYARGIAACLTAQPEARYVVLCNGTASAHLDLGRAVAYAERVQDVVTIIPLRFAK